SRSCFLGSPRRLSIDSRPQPSDVEARMRFFGEKMPLSEKDVAWIEEPELSFWDQTFLPGVLGGLKVAAKHAVEQHSVTQQYPEEKPNLPLNYRGVHRLNRDEQGRVRCVACMMCATACPAHCISIVAEDASHDWPDRDKRPQSFVLDELRCIFC